VKQNCGVWRHYFGCKITTVWIEDIEKKEMNPPPSGENFDRHVISFLYVAVSIC
jgi:hypothetical protein